MLHGEYPARELIVWYWRTYVRRIVPMILLAAVFMAAEGGALGALSYMVRPMFDEIVVTSDRDAVVRVALIVFGLFILRAAVGYMQRVLMARAGRRLSMLMQRDMLAHLIGLDFAFFHNHSPGTLIERVRGDCGAAVSIVSSTFSALGRDVVAVISLLSVAISIDPLWTLIAIAGTPVIVVPILFLQRLIKRTTRIARDAAAAIATRLDEIFHGIATIKLNANEDQQRSRFDTELDRQVQAELRVVSARAGIPALMDIVAAFGFLGVLTYGGLQIIDGEKTIGEFMSFFTAISLTFEPLRRLGGLSGGWQTALVSLERVYTVFQQRAAIVSPARPRPLPADLGKADIAVENVTFSYNGQPVLQDLDFVARAGQTTALVGASGAGKSTVFHLITRLVDPQAGAVRIAGTDIREFDLGALRSQISVVSQETLLFDDSLRDNVILDREPDEATLRAALEAAHVADFVAQMPHGVDSHVGPRGSNLSGGQRQRVAIARALLRDTPILLLDEATSALDAQSEAIVQEALERLSEGRTTIVIAHRLSTIADADNIIVMDHGRVVDQGTHQELLARGGHYADLYRLQYAAGDQR